MSKKLTKSLAELDAAADALLAKSMKAEDSQGDGSEEEISPEEVSDNVTAPKSEDADNADADKDKEPESEDKEEEEPVEKSEKSDEDLQKSDEEEGEEPSEEGNEEEGEEEKSPEEIEKSIRDDFEADDTIRKSIETSEFYAAMVDVLTKSLGDMQYDVQSQGRQSASANEVLAKSLNAMIQTNATLRADNERLTRRINKLEKSMSQGFDKVMDALDDISSQPSHMRKSMASINVHDRDFGSSINGQKVVGGFESMSKAQVLSVLNNEMFAGNQNVTAQDIISYESGAPLRQDLQSLVASKCK